MITSLQHTILATLTTHCSCAYKKEPPPQNSLRANKKCPYFPPPPSSVSPKRPPLSLPTRPSRNSPVHRHCHHVFPTLGRFASPNVAVTYLADSMLYGFGIETSVSMQEGGGGIQALVMDWTSSIVLTDVNSRNLLMRWRSSV